MSNIDLARAMGKRLRADEGQTLTEYAMLVGFIAVVVIAAAIVLGTDISSLFVPVINAFL